MAKRILKLDDLRTLNSPEGIASIFSSLGYKAKAEEIDAQGLHLSECNTNAIKKVYLIANQNNGGLQLLLFHLHSKEWEFTSMASARMKAITSQVRRTTTKFLLMATSDYSQVMLINPRVILEDGKTLKFSIRKLLIDLSNPTSYDREILESIAVGNKNAEELYQAQCEAFDVEKLTKKFYDKYKHLFDKVQKVVKEHNKHKYFDDPNTLHQFSQRLLGRIMFLYFLQKKEFLAGDRKFLTNCYGSRDLEKLDYYKDILEKLFFNTLNTKREDNNSPWGKIPYLNGGLFDKDYGSGVKDMTGRETPDTILLPNSLFSPHDNSAILGFFDNYNFTVSENVVGDESVAIDPEMLGKVFENMLEAEERGKSGTFYTPRSIVSFMCAEVLSRYLADESEMDLEVVQGLIEYDPDLIDDNELNKLITPEQAKKLKEKIKNIKVLDPAVGSGAFPLGMMQAILAVRLAIAQREGMIVRRGSLTVSQWKRDIIQNNLYGVDIKPAAIEIAKLRMWLSLVVDIPTIDNVEPLPNFDYRLMCGNSLISTIYGEPIIPDPTKDQQGMLSVTPIQEAIQPMLELQQQYFNVHTEERQKLLQRVLEAEANVYQVAVADRLEYLYKKQQKLNRDINVLKGKSSTKQEEERKDIEKDIQELNKFAAKVESGKRSLNFFQYHLHFRDVFTEKGGFDVVIGNPPYVGQKGNKEIFEEIKKGSLGRFYKRNMDIFYFFYHLALDTGKNNAFIAFINTNYFLTADGSSLLRQDIKKRSIILKILDFNEYRIFPSAKGQHNLIMIIKKDIEQNKRLSSAQITIVKRKEDATFETLEKIIKQLDSQTLYYTQTHSSLFSRDDNFYIRIQESTDNNSKISQEYAASDKHFGISTILDKINSKTENRLSDVCKINTGVQTGCDKVTDKHIINGFINNTQLKNKGIYVLSKEEKIALKLNPIEENIIKPFYKNSDVKRYYCNNITKKYLIYATRDLDIDNYPNIRNHLYSFENLIKTRSYNRGEIKAALKEGKWWVIFQQKEPHIFESEKIICPQRSHINSFSFTDKIWYASKDIYFININPLFFDKILIKYVLGLLNSDMYFLWLYFRGKRKGEKLELYYTPLTQIPILIPTIQEQKKVEALVNKILTVKQSNPDSDTSQHETKINKLIYQLYNLTEEEIAIVEKCSMTLKIP